MLQLLVSFLVHLWKKGAELLLLFSMLLCGSSYVIACVHLFSSVSESSCIHNASGQELKIGLWCFPNRQRSFFCILCVFFGVIWMWNMMFLNDVRLRNVIVLYLVIPKISVFFASKSTFLSLLFVIRALQFNFLSWCSW